MMRRSCTIVNVDGAGDVDFDRRMGLIPRVEGLLRFRVDAEVHFGSFVFRALASPVAEHDDEGY